MAIHHTHLKQAEKRGFLLEQHADGRIRAFWPAHAVEVFAGTSAEARDNMIKLQDTYDDDFESDMSPPEPDKPTHDATGVPLNGRIAYESGFAAADNPFSTDGDEEEYDNATKWDEEWDAAADEAEEEGPHSVVSEKYRAIYAEQGHPTHCGDDLAVLLNNLCQTKEGTDLGRFEAICEANGVNLGKYNRTSNGWQGRLRMTGRNLLARKVWDNDGMLQMPPDFDGAEPQYQMSSDWMATRKFRKGV
jgi:hypothetical protein